MSGILTELLYRFWVSFEKMVAWWLRRRKGADVVVREVWWARRETSEGYLGTETTYKPTPRIIRLLELLAWYSPPGQLIVWRIKRSDW